MHFSIIVGIFSDVHDEQNMNNVPGYPFVFVAYTIVYFLFSLLFVHAIEVQTTTNNQQ